jgi:selenocysteine lyase/cysteine desulfurase
MKIDTDQLLTIEQAAEAIGAPNKRPVYRALKRAAEAGRVLSVSLFGKTLVPQANIEELKEYYYPYYSEAHQRVVKSWGAAGGRKSAVTKKLKKSRGQS